MFRQIKQQHIAPLLRVLMVCGLLLGLLGTAPAKSISLPSAGVHRIVTIEVDYTIYEWWLLSWKTSEIVCQIYTEHDSWPDNSEVLYYCGSTIQKQWVNTSACDENMTNPQDCKGLYLYRASETPSKRMVEISLPSPEVFVSITNCNQEPGQANCTTLPYLRLQAVEPLPNEQIIQILGTVNGAGFSCPGSACDLPLGPTGMEGVQVEFWAESSYGDSSQRYKAQVRVIPWGDFANPDQPATDKPSYYVDVLSSQWLGEGQSTCSEIWQSFLPVDGPPSWLRTPELAEELVSTNEYFLLAGMLIQQGLVDASSSPSGGLEANGAANVWGMEIAQPVVDDWQNQFDAEIIRVADDTGVPAQLMKNIFSRESQFWPGIYEKVREAGLGHLSDIGADAVLLWNPAFYSQFCPLILTDETCQRGFGNLDLAQQEMLRGALVQKVNAACPDCPVGIDLTQANFSISIFARSILANCEQVRQIIYNNTGRQPGQVAKYEDLWKFTLLNYNAGPGCLGNAMQRTINNGNPLTWENIAYNLQEACRPGIEYVDDISHMPLPDEGGIGELLSTPEPGTYLPTPTISPTPRPIILTPTPGPTSTPGPTTTPGPTATPTQTATPGGTAYPGPTVTTEPTLTGTPYP